MGLTVEGIINKTQRLILRNKQLKERVSQLETDQQKLLEQLNEQANQIRDLETRLSSSHIGSVLETDDSGQARQKVNELLREIEKCYALLNR